MSMITRALAEVTLSRVDDGSAGKSAYESAQDAGYSGTETQFNTDLADVSDTKVTAETALETAENILIYDHEYSYVDGVYTFTAHLYQGGVDIKSQYEPTQFVWYYKTEDGQAPVPLSNNVVDGNYESYGYTITISNSTHIKIKDFHYGGHVIGRFIPDENAELLTEGDENLTNGEGQNYTGRTASGDSVRVSDLTVSTTLFPTEKLMVVGTEDEHLVTIQTLQDYLNANLDKQVLFNTTAGWSAQTTLVSRADTLYVYTDHQRDSGGNAIAGIKAGDGLAYVVDLPFTDAIATEHIADTTRHITASERSAWNNHVASSTIHVTASDKERWDSAVKCYYAGTEQLVFAVV